MLKSVKNRQADALARISWQDFERLLADHYRDLGYQVEHHGTGSSGAHSDGGIDLKLRKGDEFILVQCKHWNAMQVPHNDVHQLMGIMDNQDATDAILVTSGEFTPAAQAAAARKGKVQLVDGVALRQMLGARLPPESPAGIDRSPMPVPLTPHGFSRRGRTRGNSGRSKPSIEKAIVAVVGFVLVVALILIVRDRIVTVIARFGPKPPTSAQSTLVRDSSLVAAPQIATRAAIDSGRGVQVVTSADLAAQRAAEEALVEEQRRANAESMKILEATTPALKE